MCLVHAVLVDTSLCRDLHSQQTSRAESLEAKLQGAENELKSTSTLLHERANQITGLQRDVEHKQASLTALNATLKCERDRQSKIELQLDAASEKVASLQTETSGLRQKAEFAERRAAEREASSQQMQARSDTLQSSLRAEYEKVGMTMSIVQSQIILHTSVFTVQYYMTVWSHNICLVKYMYIYMYDLMLELEVNCDFLL